MIGLDKGPVQGQGGKENPGSGLLPLPDGPGRGFFPDGIVIFFCPGSPIAEPFLFPVQSYPEFLFLLLQCRYLPIQVQHPLPQPLYLLPRHPQGDDKLPPLCCRRV